jgi:nitric oxide reductase NorQ protein
LVEHVAAKVGVDLYTVSCHEDMTATDLLGRFTLAGGQTEWVDGPLTRAVRAGAICYLDEIVEARQDAVVAIHSLCDHRRELFIERQGGTKLTAAQGFQLVVSYNPGYQSILKDLKVSTRQRMVSIELTFPTPEVERAVLIQEAGASAELADELVGLAAALRRITDAGLREVASTRMLIATAALAGRGLPLRQAARAAIVGPLTDDSTLAAGLLAVIDAYTGGKNP